MSRTPNRNYPYPDPGQTYLLTTDLAELAKAIDTDVSGVSAATTPSVAVNDLTDVDTATSPAVDGQALVYSTADGLWKPGTMSVTNAGATELNGLSDVDTVTAPPASGQALVYDGSMWAPATVSGGSGGGATTLDALTDVDTTTVVPVVGQSLVWDGTNWVPGTVSGGTTGSASVLVIDQGGAVPAGTPDGTIVFERTA